MISVEELFATMREPVIDESILLTIDENTRVITIPDKAIVLAAEGDKDVNRVQFKMKRYFREVDMAKFEARINYQTALGNRYFYVVDDLVPQGDYILFSWLVSNYAAEEDGTVQFSLCMRQMSGENVVREFNSTTAKAKCLPSIHDEEAADDNPISETVTILDESELGATVLG